MLRDRFNVWNAEPKYNRHQPVQPRRQRRKTRALAGSDAVEFRVAVDVRVRCQHGGHYSISGSDLIPTLSVPEAHGDLAGPQRPHITSLSRGSRLPLAQSPVWQDAMTHLPSPEPSRTPDTPKEDWHLQNTLKEVAGYIDRIVERGSWINRREDPAFELQALAASAHMAISSQSYDCHHIWHELVSCPFLWLLQQGEQFLCRTSKRTGQFTSTNRANCTIQSPKSCPNSAKIIY